MVPPEIPLIALVMSSIAVPLITPAATPPRGVTAVAVQIPGPVQIPDAKDVPKNVQVKQGLTEL